MPSAAPRHVLASRTPPGADPAKVRELLVRAGSVEARALTVPGQVAGGRRLAKACSRLARAA
jgi:hypothetical protein